MKHSLIRSGTFKPFYKICFWLFLVTCILLGWIGGIPVIEPYLSIGRFLSVLYFVIILVFLPISIFIERIIYDIYIK
jgi:ubiquinol-cytochrome c reductase cytochrome b subunit